MAIEMVPYREEWPQQFEQARSALAQSLAGVEIISIEHVGSTAVPGLAAKPVLDIDVLVRPDQVAAAVEALAAVGYVHRGDLGIPGRQAMGAPDERPRRHVYVCEAGSLSVRNHLAVRDVLRRRPDLRDSYAAVKVALAGDPSLDMAGYLAGKSAILQQILAESDLTESERWGILRLNDPSSVLRPMTESDVLRVVAVQEPGAILGLAAVFPQHEHPFPREAIAQRWRDEIADADIDCYVVRREYHTVEGFAAIRDDEFLHFGIAVECWGTGLARQAHDAVLERLRRRGVERAWLRVFTNNGRGRRFYEKLGWQPTGEVTRSSYAPFPELLTYEVSINTGIG